MTTGNISNLNSLHPRVYWRVGGYGEPQSLDSREWSGADGFNQINAYSGQYERYYQGYVHSKRWSTTREEFSSTVYHAYYCSAFPNGPNGCSTAADLTAMDRLIEQITGTSFALNIFLGEAPESLVYLYKRITPILKSIRYFKRGDVIRGFRAIGLKKIKGKRLVRPNRSDWFVPASWWLEYRYAISPMIMDCNDILEHLDRDLGKPRKVRVKKGSKIELPHVYPYVSSGSWGMSDLKYWPNLKCTQYCTVGCRIMEDFDYIKVDWMNPWTVIWELTPFSFIVDWFCQIGNFLRARWFFKFSKFEDGFISRLLKYNTGNPVGYSLSSYPLAGWSADCTFDKSYHERIFAEREKWFGSVPFPTVINPLSKTSHWRRLVDALAILSTLSESALDPALRRRVR